VPHLVGSRAEGSPAIRIQWIKQVQMLSTFRPLCMYVTWLNVEMRLMQIKLLNSLITITELCRLISYYQVGDTASQDYPGYS